MPKSWRHLVQAAKQINGSDAFQVLIIFHIYPEALRQTASPISRQKMNHFQDIFIRVISQSILCIDRNLSLIRFYNLITTLYSFKVMENKRRSSSAIFLVDGGSKLAQNTAPERKNKKRKFRYDLDKVTSKGRFF